MMSQHSTTLSATRVGSLLLLELSDFKVAPTWKRTPSSLNEDLSYSGTIFSSSTQNEYLYIQFEQSISSMQHCLMPALPKALRCWPELVLVSGGDR